jgi:hypothetical protein
MPRSKYNLATPLQQSVLALELCTMQTASDGHYVVEATVPLSDINAKLGGSCPSTGIMTLDQLDTPCFLVRMPIVERNCRSMAERCAAAGIALRPHVKT